MRRATLSLLMLSHLGLFYNPGELVPCWLWSSGELNLHKEGHDRGLDGYWMIMIPMSWIFQMYEYLYDHYNM